MKLASLLFKPKWQDRDAGVRAAAVAADGDPALVDALPELTRSDPDPRVRLAALKRLGDYERWRERSTADADPGVRRTARETYLALLCAGGAKRPALARVIKELETLSPAEIETVVAEADAPDIRRAALGYVTRPALLAERATRDPDAALRQAALARVDDPALLERIAERTRKTDKTINRTARERLVATRLDARDAGAIAVRAAELCARLDALLRSPEAIEPARSVIEGEWRKLGDDVPAHLVARYRGALALLERHVQRSVPVEPAVETAAAAPAGETPDSAAHESAPQTAAPAPATDHEQLAVTLAAKARFEAALVAAREEAAREREQRSARLAGCAALVDRFAQCIDAGDTAGAHALHAQIAAIEADLGPLPGALAHRLEPLRVRHAELRRWQHWSNQRRRRALCDEIEQLAATRVHPDAIAARVRDARAEWQQLDAHEGESAGAAPLARRFHAVCQRALKPAAGYFEKRAAVRSARTRELEALLERAGALPPESDPRALGAARHDLAAALRTLDEVDPHERSALARRIKDAIDAIAARLQANADRVASAKAKLIAAAAGLKPGDRSAPRSVRELQQQWTALGEGARAADQRQWREFRAACDRVFTALDSERREREAQAAEQAGQVRALLDETEAWLRDDALSAEALIEKRHEIESRWRGFAEVDRAQERRCRALLDALAARAAERARAARFAHFDAAFAAYGELRRHERGVAPAPTAETIDALTPRFRAALAARAGRASAAGGDPLAADAAAREILVALEFAGGVPSPDEDRQLRMDHQVRRLSARMRGAAATDAEEELTGLIERWLSLPGPMPDPLEARFDAAARAASRLLP